MKIFLVTLLMALQANAYQVTLKFKNKEEARQWVVWYLDGGGEQSSDFYANDFDITDVINGDGRTINTAPYLFLVCDKEYDCEWTKRRSYR